ncbi:unnamed protein product [Paramecium sonneborni]|uniref:Uncharacterized protein n=1 Tax=Paramecium sonneborni TaxID=65129 RepID=A0A8S1RTN0_9CILI|nr:unnamed protein product [Paramecium sonneborni]
MNFLKSFDQFGVSYKQEIFKNEKQFKSAFGGITSLLLYTLSLVYFFINCFFGQMGTNYLEFQFKNQHKIMLMYHLNMILLYFKLWE